MNLDSKLVERTYSQQPTIASNDDGTTTFAALLESYKPEPLRRGQIVEGQILQIEDNLIYADVGAKRTAIVPPQDLDNVQEEIVNGLSVGDEVLLYVTQTPRGDDDLIVSLKRGLQQQDWVHAHRYMEADEMIELEVVGHNKGGVLVAFGHLRGFIPNSHVPELYRIRDPRKRASYKAKLMGEKVPLKVIEIDESRKRLVFSVKAAQKELRQRRLNELVEGEIVTGRVINIVDFGAFVDLGEVDGLVHISNLAWHQVDHPSQVVSVGEEIEVRIDSVDVERERVGLNHKVCTPNPWQKFDEEHEAGDLIEGVVTNVTDFGAFVLVSGNIEGLVHISEMRIYDNSQPQDVLQTGDVVIVRLLNVDTESERIRLSQRRVSATEEMEWMTRRQRPAAVPPAAEVETEEADEDEDSLPATEEMVTAEAEPALTV